MVETIAPVVHGTRARWLGTLALHAFGATATAAIFGALLGWTGAALGAPWYRPGLVALAAVSAVYALGSLTSLRVSVPQLRRQVPDWWRSFFGKPFAAVLYGAGLGIGFFTYLSGGALVVVAFAAVASGRAAVGAAMVAPFGLVRGLSAVISWRSVTRQRSRVLVDRLVATADRIRRTATGVALSLIAIMAIAASARVAGGGWWRFAAAVLAAVFTWASASKLTSPRRWRRALAAYHLTPALERAAVWGVPMGEAIVLVLVLVGLPRAAALWSILLLSAFSIVLLRARGAEGRVPCGCFGGRQTVDAASALLRNVVLILTAVLVLVRGVDAPAVAWPGSPTASDAVPMLLTFGALAAAAVSAWRASVWLARGRRA